MLVIAAISMTGTYAASIADAQVAPVAVEASAHDSVDSIALPVSEVVLDAGVATPDVVVTDTPVVTALPTSGTLDGSMTPSTDGAEAGDNAPTANPVMPSLSDESEEPQAVDTTHVASPVPTIDVPTPTETGSTRRHSSSGGSRNRVASTSQGIVLGATDFKFLNDLSIGMQSNDVMELQKRLRAEGFFTFPTDTGYFGPITFAAAKAYQEAHFNQIGYVTGFVGPLTRAVLNQ